MGFIITCGPEGHLYDWQAGLCITPEGSQVIPELTRGRGPCPTCRRKDTELRGGICLRCFVDGPDDHDDDN